MKQRALLQHRFIFQQPISTQSLENQRALITRELKIRPVQPSKEPLQQLKKTDYALATSSGMSAYCFSACKVFPVGAKSRLPRVICMAVLFAG